MKTIIVMRHAKAVSKSHKINESDRKLKKKGVLATKNVAKKIMHFGIVPDLIISSPVTRALSTSQILADYFDLKQNILFRNYIFDSQFTFNDILNDIKDFDNESNTIIIVGHNPTISNLLNQINPSTDEHLKTSGTVVFDFNVDNWSEVNISNSIYRCFIDKKGK